MVSIHENTRGRKSCATVPSRKEKQFKTFVVFIPTLKKIKNTRRKSSSSRFLSFYPLFAIYPYPPFFSNMVLWWWKTSTSKLFPGGVDGQSFVPWGESLEGESIRSREMGSWCILCLLGAHDFSYKSDTQPLHTKPQTPRHFLGIYPRQAENMEPKHTMTTSLCFISQ
jgi:hypothetical protein